MNGNPIHTHTTPPTHPPLLSSLVIQPVTEANDVIHKQRRAYFIRFLHLSSISFFFSFSSLSLYNSMTASHHTFTYHHSSSLLDSPQHHHPSDDLLHLKPQHLSGTTFSPPFFYNKRSRRSWHLLLLLLFRACGSRRGWARKFISCYHWFNVDIIMRWLAVIHNNASTATATTPSCIHTPCRQLCYYKDSSQHILVYICESIIWWRKGSWIDYPSHSTFSITTTSRSASSDP